MDNYLELLQLEPSPDTYEKVSAAGDVCLSLTSSWSALLLSLRHYWEHLHGSHFQGLFDNAIDELTPHAGLLQSARKIAQAGVDARTEVVFPRVHAKNHSSAKDHLEQALAEIWKDAQKMRVSFALANQNRSWAVPFRSPLAGFLKLSLIEQLVNMKAVWSTTQDLSTMRVRSTNTSLL
jgi:hypothetical protein